MAREFGGSFPEAKSLPVTKPDLRARHEWRLHDFGVQPKAAEYDAELFLDQAERLAAEWEAANDKERKQLAVRWYFDTVAPRLDATETEHARLSAMPPLALGHYNELKSTTVNIAGNMSLAGRRDYGSTRWSEISLYGPAAIIDVAAGSLASIDLGEYDIVGTSGLSQCQALIGRSEYRVAVSHVLYGQEELVPELASAMRQQLGPQAELQYIHPQAAISPFATERDKRAAKEHNDGYLKIADANGLKPHGYYRVDADYNPDDIGSSAVVMSRAGTSLVATRLAYKHPAWKGHDRRRWLQKIIRTEDL